MSDVEANIRQVIGENVRRLRTVTGATQDDVAAEARALGLPWDRSKIAALERGGKAIDVAQLVLLAEALSAATGEQLRLGDLFEGTGSLRLSPNRIMTRRVLRTYLSAKFVRTGSYAAAPAESWSGEAEERAARELGLTAAEVARASVDLWGRTLTEERDAMASEQFGGRAQLRGRATRVLVDELRDHLTARPAK